MDPLLLPTHTRTHSPSLIPPHMNLLPAARPIPWLTGVGIYLLVSLPSSLSSCDQVLHWGLLCQGP